METFHPQIANERLPQFTQAVRDNPSLFETIIRYTEENPGASLKPLDVTHLLGSNADPLLRPALNNMRLSVTRTLFAELPEPIPMARIDTVSTPRGPSLKLLSNKSMSDRLTSQYQNHNGD